MDSLTVLLLVAAGAGLLVLLFKVLKTPLKWVLKLLISAVFGFIALFVLNFFGSSIGLTLGLNWFNAIITGVLGVPGVILLLLIKYLL